MVKIVDWARFLSPKYLVAREVHHYSFRRFKKWAVCNSLVLSVTALYDARDLSSVASFASLIRSKVLFLHSLQFVFPGGVGLSTRSFMEAFTVRSDSFLCIRLQPFQIDFHRVLTFSFIWLETRCSVCTSSTFLLCITPTTTSSHFETLLQGRNWGWFKPRSYTKHTRWI